MCEQTLNRTYTARDPDGKSYTTNGHVIPDCRIDPRFEQRPYVVAEPGLRFHAGVPIISRNGHKIGAYAVCDEAPRAGLSVDELRFMQDMAQVAMEHLEWARDRVDRFKGERIVRGLAAFIEGSSTVLDDDTKYAEKNRGPETGLPPLCRPPELSLAATRPPLTRASSDFPYPESDRVRRHHAPPPSGPHKSGCKLREEPWAYCQLCKYLCTSRSRCSSDEFNMVIQTQTKWERLRTK